MGVSLSNLEVGRMVLDRPVAVLVVSFLVYITWRLIYNRHLHPLRRYPGPFLSTASRLPFAIAYAKGTLHLHSQALHRKYGDVVRIAPDELSYTDEQAWKDIYGASRNFPKDTRFYNASTKKAPSVLTAPDNVHSCQKRAILRAFSETALRDHERVLQPLVGEFIDQLGHISEQKNGVVDFEQWYNYIMFDFMAKELFGETLGCLKHAAFHPWADMLFASIKAWAFLSVIKYFPYFTFILKPLVLFYCRDLLRHRDAKHNSIASKTPQRSEVMPLIPDFISYISDSTDPKSTLLPKELFANTSFLMMAGSETTATLLSGCTYLLLKNPATYTELATQVRSLFRSPSEMTFAAATRIPYLRSVLQESLRMYPPLPLGMPRVVPAGGALISGRYVPEKTSVSVSSWSAYQSPKNFTNPRTFLPERWLDSEHEVGGGDKQGVFQPFSLGPRGCPGRSLAFAEASLIISRLVWEFDLELAEDSRDWGVGQRAFIVWDKGPLHVRLVKRAENV
ncbi:cytochrome P450 [Aspergillus pseudoustus]|uniref:Cytochrome P450 n=1 Tax=Aspergillus pseudoustus TaxID=1810923 RepID=A0ABR4IFR1_9EURO